MGSAWMILFLAGLFEVLWAVGLKYSDGFTKLAPSVLTVMGMLVSFVLLSKAVRTIPLGTGYAVWTGIGVAGTAIAGLFLFKEPLGLVRAVSFLFLLIGIAGLKLSS